MRPAWVVRAPLPVVVFGYDKTVRMCVLCQLGVAIACGCEQSAGIFSWHTHRPLRRAMALWPLYGFALSLHMSPRPRGRWRAVWAAQN